MSWRVRLMPFGLLVAALAFGFGSPTARAQVVVPPSAVEFEDSEIFRPTTDGGDYVTVYDSDTLPTKTPGARRFHLGVYGDYAHNPIEVQFERSGDLFTHVVKNLGTVQLSGAFGILDFWEVGLRVPGYIADNEDVNFAGDRVGGTEVNVGDLVLNTKFTLLRREVMGLGLAVMPEVTLPTGSREDFIGTGKLGYGGLFIADVYPTDGFHLALNAGGVIRDKVGGGPLQDSDDDFNDQFRYGLAASFDVSPALTLITEAYGAADTHKPFDAERKTPLDVIGALRFHLNPVMDLTVGGGAGVTKGQGSPDFRVFVGLTTPKPSREIKQAIGGDLSQSRKTYALEDRNGDGRPSPGDVLQYQITILNTGTTPATNVVVEDPIPEHTAYVPGSITINGRPMSDAVGDDDGEYAAPATIIARAAQVGTSAEDNHVDITFKVGIDTEITAPTPIVNQAMASADNIPQFPLPPAQTMVFPAVPQHEHVIVGPEKLELTEDIHFEFDKAVIQPVSYPILKELAQVLKEYPDLRIRVEGNTDSVGSDEYNQKLSDRRAKAVRDFLIGVGIAGERMQSIGRGETNPIASNDTSAGRAMNRRTEFIVLNPEAVKNAVLQPERSKSDLAPQSEPAWLKGHKGTPPR
jgi:OmpA-OmpF porin, OOP family